MEKPKVEAISQPWKRSLVSCQVMSRFGQRIITAEGGSLLLDYEEGEYGSNHQLRVDLFKMLGQYLDQLSFDENQFVELTNIFVKLEYSEEEIQAVLQFLRKLKEEDNIYISTMVERIKTYQVLDLVESIDQDYQGFVRDCLPTKEKKLAVLNYIKGNNTKNIKWFVDDATVEMIDMYIEDETIRERMIVLLEVETMV